LHIHTQAIEASVKDIVVAYEKNEKGGETEKIKPQFTRSGARIIARVSTRIPIPLEKYETVPEMGRFTLRDESRTIALGRVLKYKPAKVTLYEETKVSAGITVKEEKGADSQKDLIFNYETGETMTKEERMNGKMGAIAEGDEDEDEDSSVPRGVT